MINLWIVSGVAQEDAQSGTGQKGEYCRLKVLNQIGSFKTYLTAFAQDKYIDLIKDVKKGDLVILQGGPRASAYGGNDSQPKASLNINVFKCEKVGGKVQTESDPDMPF